MKKAEGGNIDIIFSLTMVMNFILIYFLSCSHSGFVPSISNKNTFASSNSNKVYLHPKTFDRDATIPQDEVLQNSSTDFCINPPVEINIIKPILKIGNLNYLLGHIFQHPYHNPDWSYLQSIKYRQNKYFIKNCFDNEPEGWKVFSYLSSILTLV